MKKLISILMCLMLFVCTTFTEVKAAETTVYQKYVNLNKKINIALNKNVPPTEIFESLSKDEVKTLMDEYSKANVSSSYGFTSEVVNNPEVKSIDDLANSYFKEYKRTGILPATTSSNYSVNTFSATTADYSSIMQGLGYNYTLQQIAAQLAAIGAYLSISSAFPFLSLVALIIGMGILVFTAITVAYCAVAVGANNLILTWYYMAATNLLNARTTTAAVLAQKEQGVIYWLASLVNYSGLGGIAPIRPINQLEAEDTVNANLSNPNVLACDVNAAGFLATKCSPRYGITWHTPHNSDVQILNMYHCHANTGPSILGKTHIFYLTYY